MSRRLSTAEFPDLLPGGSAVTGEAGTVSGQSGQHAPQGKAAGIHPPASLQAPQGPRRGFDVQPYRSAAPGAFVRGTV